MSFIHESSQAETNYTQIKELATRRFLNRLRKIGQGFWSYTEETSETNIKPYKGWQ